MWPLRPHGCFLIIAAGRLSRAQSEEDEALAGLYSRPAGPHMLCDCICECVCAYVYMCVYACVCVHAYGMGQPRPGHTH